MILVLLVVQIFLSIQCGIVSTTYGSGEDCSGEWFEKIWQEPDFCFSSVKLTISGTTVSKVQYPARIDCENDLNGTEFSASTQECVEGDVPETGVEYSQNTRSKFSTGVKFKAGSDIAMIEYDSEDNCKGEILRIVVLKRRTAEGIANFDAYVSDNCGGRITNEVSDCDQTPYRTSNRYYCGVDPWAEKPDANAITPGQAVGIVFAVLGFIFLFIGIIVAVVIMWIYLHKYEEKKKKESLGRKKKRRDTRALREKESDNLKEKIAKEDKRQEEDEEESSSSEDEDEVEEKKKDSKHNRRISLFEPLKPDDIADVKQKKYSTQE